MIRLSWITLPGGHGYGRVGDELRPALKLAGAHNLEPQEFGWDALIACHPPTCAWHVGPYTTRPDLVYHTMAETDRIPDWWVTILNKSGCLWTPSRWCEQVFRDNGVRIPIITSPYGVRVDAVQRSVRDAPFRVLAWGDSLYSRKNITSVIDAFIAADLSNAVLEVKLNLEEIELPTMQWMDASGRPYDNIHIIHQKWHDQKLREWLLSGDCGIYLSGGEGWGLMPMEMMATGLPMISVAHTGMLEYLHPDRDHSVFLHVLARRQSSAFFVKNAYPSDATAYVPDIGMAVDQLRWAYHHRAQLAEMGMRGARHVASYTWESAGYAAYGNLHALYGHA